MGAVPIRKKIVGLAEMAFNEYIQSGGKYLRCGYTTGTCAALAAGAAARLLLTGNVPESVALITPKGVRVEVVPDVCEYVSGEENGHSGRSRSTRAAVRKDAGDDKDATNGILIYATVTEESERKCGCRTYDKYRKEFEADDEYVARADGLFIMIDGGDGVGRVTKPGLDQPVGNAAINHVPRAMIEKAVRDVCELTGYQGRLRVVISVPEGERVAKKTFNEHLGIEGGISILGTSGIVEPMSMQAFIDAVCVEIRQVRRMDESGRLILTPGNYGMDFLKEYLGRGSAEDGAEMSTGAEMRFATDLKIPIVACSNFIGDALDAAAAEGFREVLLVGHIGKLVKLAGGVMNTHSRYADCRMELFAAHAAICGADADVCRRLMACVTTDACVEILREEGICQNVMNALLLSMEKYLLRRVGGAYRVGAMTFSNVHGPLGATPEAETILRNWGLYPVMR